MTLSLDPQLEQRIQHEMEVGHHQSPADVISYALELLEEGRKELESDETFDSRLQRSMAAARRGELYTPEEARQILAERRASRG